MGEAEPDLDWAASSSHAGIGTEKQILNQVDGVGTEGSCRIRSTQHAKAKYYLSS